MDPAPPTTLLGTGKRRLAFVLTLALIGSLLAILPSFAGHSEASLAGSNFEIDTDANLKVDDVGKLDWANVTQTRRQDKPSGKNDDSYSGGTKEDTECPSATTGSIPNNKSDLLEFGVYEEEGAPGEAGYLHLYWSRVNEPTGTTLMDFEFNQSSTKCATGPNVLRTPGDILLEYAIEQGGARADITIRRWTAAGAWGPANQLSATQATGTINNSPIPASDSDGLIASGELSPRTFGEATIDLEAIFEAGKCESFGSAMLKSRASSSFTSQLKDFIEPVGITLTNCGKVIIRKETDPETTETFGFTKDFATDPSSSDTFSLSDEGVKTFDGVLFGEDYTVTEDDLPPDWEFVSVDCSAGNVTPTSIVGATVTFDIASDDDVLDCTYTNEQLTGSIVAIKVDENQDLLGDAGLTITPGDIVMTEYADGVFCSDGLDFGDYTVTETTVPPGYTGGLPDDVTVASASTCADRIDDVTGLPDPTDDVDLTFTNNPEPGTVNIHKEDDAGNPLPDIGFTLFVDDNEDGEYQETETEVAKTEQFTDSEGKITFTDVPLGFYCAVETTSSSDHSPAAPQCFEVGLGDTAGEGQTIALDTFVNERLHKVIVVVCHQGTDTLAESKVTNGTGELQTLAEDDALEDVLCALDGFTGKPHGDKALTVDVGSDAHPSD